MKIKCCFLGLCPHLALPLPVVYPEVDGVEGEAAVPRPGVAPQLVLAPEHAHRLACLAPPTLPQLQD